MVYNDVRENKNKGFSLVELIVVIAIMAVLVAVLAPALLQYVERSCAQKDDSAMGEVTNAILLAMSDQDVFDEVLYYTAYGNVACYIDQDTEGALSAAAKASKHVTKKAETGSTNTADQYLFGDDARLRDEVIYTAGGNMRGVTITFQPHRNSNASEFIMEEAIINKFMETGQTRAADAANGITAISVVAETNKVATDRVAQTKKYINATPDYSTKGYLGAMASGSSANCYLYNRVRATIGDSVTLTSQTYRNSEYTVFIRMGTTGGNQASAQDAIAVYGQWNGTNLLASAPTT
jgi:prepilin-type N-terminal cleavage/methylation domain-containing protein